MGGIINTLVLYVSPMCQVFSFSVIPSPEVAMSETDEALVTLRNNGILFRSKYSFHYKIVDHYLMFSK